MASGTNKSIDSIAVIAVTIPILIGAWFAAPMFLPMYKWFHVNIPAISRATGKPEKSLETRFKLKLTYNPRGEGDPVPWQIIDSDPAFESVYPGNDNDETKLLVRCNLISANDGKPPSTTFINSTYQDRYFNVEGLRLPPGALPGLPPKRPIILYAPLDMTKMSINDASTWRNAVSTGGYENDDDWDERDDGWRPPKQ